MADTTALKNRIRSAIKANDNQEITGPVLQQALLDIVDELNGATETEAEQRQSADSTLQQSITAEKNRAEGAESTLQQNIATEATERQQGDTQLNNLITGIKNNIDNGYVYAGIATPSTVPVSGKMFYVAVQAGTYTNFGGTAVTEGIAILKYNGTSWVKEQVMLTDGGVFDISAYHAIGGTLATYTDLSAALDSNNGGGVPQSLQKGGMSVKFVRTSDNKYVQCRCMAQNFTTDITQWQGVDDEPTAGSQNLVKSGGVAEKMPNLLFGGFSKRISYPMSGLTKTYLICYLSLHTGHKYRAIINDEGTLITSGFAIRKEYESDTDTLMSATVDGTQGTITREFTVNAEKENYVLVLYQTGSATITGTNTAYIFIEDITVNAGSVDENSLTNELSDNIGSYGSNIDLHIKNERSPYLSAKNGASIDSTSQTLTIPSGSTGYTSDIGAREETLVSGQRNCLIVHLKLLSGNWGDVFLFANSGFQKIIAISDTERIYYLYRDYVSRSGERLYFYFRRTTNSAIDHDFSMQVVHVYRWNYSLTDISSNQTIYIDNLKNAISDDIVFSVKKDGTADYTTLRAALEAAKKYTNVGKIVTINLSADTYELSDEYTTEELADTSFYGWPIGNNINLIGDENGTILSGNLTDAVASQSREGSGATNIGGFVATIDIVSMNCLLQNLEVRGYNVRYCVHDDRSAAGSVHKLKNCKFIRYNSTYGFKAAYGAGCRANSKFVAEQCVFITEMPSATAFSMHDNVSFYKPASIVFKGCTFIGNGEYDVAVISQGHGLSIRNTAWFENCTFNTFGLCVKESAYAVSPYYDWEVSGTNNNGFYQISQIAADADVHIVNFFDEIKICTTSSTLHTGSPVILTSNNVCGMAHSSAWGKIAGIVLGVVDGKVYVKTKGDIHKSILGISDNVPTGRFYKVSANDYVVTTEDDWYLLCKTPNVLTIR